MATSRPSAEPAHHVVLVGMMGAGKSSVGALLAERLGLQHFDVDAWIEDEEGASIGTIFATRGEAAFRALEAQMLPSFLAAERPCVLSVGGGAVTQEGTREKLAGAGRVVWLRARTDTLVERVGDASTRPLLAGGEVAAALAQLSAERESLYEDVADLVIDVDDLSVDEVVARIVEALG